jgi:membrane protease YdiL (CAAX protease family)
MLFAIKRRPGPALALLVVFVAAALAARAALDLTWRWEVRPLSLLLGAVVLTGSDGLLHGGLTLALGQGYLDRYRALVEYFRPQRWPAIIAGGLLAGGEELIFRGILLEALRARLELPDAAAVGVASLLFGLSHAIPQRNLLPFVWWAVWEGTLLGGVYVVSDSLGTVVVLHVLHDVAGFSLFAWQRRTGWLLGK